jgi:hypothetical protein
MSTTTLLINAQRLLEAALQQALQERDRAVFEVARGERSLQQLLRLAERVALVRVLALQTRALFSPAEERSERKCFQAGEHWQGEGGLYRVEACPLIPSCVRLVPLGGASRAPLYRHPRNTSQFQRLRP